MMATLAAPCTADSGSQRFLLLPGDVLDQVAEQCGAASVLALSCCSKGLQVLASDSSLWIRLLRSRHRVLVGESDPYQALLPSAALDKRRDCHDASPRSLVESPSWPELYRACEREWLDAQPEPRTVTWTVWLAWQHMFDVPVGDSAAGWLLVLRILGPRPSAGPLCSTTLACNICVLAGVAALCAWLALPTKVI